MTPSPETRLRIRRELAERMGMRKCSLDSNCWIIDGNHTKFDPFTDHADCAALVAWLAEQNEESNLEVFSQISNRWIKVPVWQKFLYKLQFLLFQCDFTSPPLDVVMNIMTSPLPVRVLAACVALGIATNDEADDCPHRNRKRVPHYPPVKLVDGGVPLTAEVQLIEICEDCHATRGGEQA